MTTKAAEKLYQAQHEVAMENKGYAVYNPNDKPLEELPVIYGFNNGGVTGRLRATLVSEDGKWLGGHICSSEAYMPHDLGVLEGTRPDRHETFKEHYPDGYRMEFVGYDEFNSHEKLKAACVLGTTKTLGITRTGESKDVET